MATTVASRKGKGRRLQDFARDVFRVIFKDQLEEGDIVSRQMGGAGTDVVLSPLAKKLIVFDIECKNVEKLNINEAYNQCVANTEKNRIPLLIYTKNHSNVMVNISILHLFKLKNIEMEEKYKDVIVTMNFGDFISVAYPEWKGEIGKKSKWSIIF